MTTPLNFIFAPFGMDWVFEVRFLVVWVFEAWPKVSGVTANNRARPQTSLIGRHCLISLAFII
jgi:hypothetical protein